MIAQPTVRCYRRLGFNLREGPGLRESCSLWRSFCVSRRKEAEKPPPDSLSSRACCSVALLERRLSVPHYEIVELFGQLVCLIDMASLLLASNLGDAGGCPYLFINR